MNIYFKSSFLVSGAEALSLSVSQGISSYNPFKVNTNSSCELLLSKAQEALNFVRLEQAGSISVSGAAGVL